MATAQSVKIVVCARCCSDAFVDGDRASAAGWAVMVMASQAEPEPVDFPLCPACAADLRAFMAETPKRKAPE